MSVDFKSIVPNGSRVSSGWGRRDAPTTGASTTHKGSDIAAPLGASIINQAEGKVVFVGTATGFGANTVIVEHQLPDGSYAYRLYGHMASTGVKQGDTIAAGAQIGTVGNEGIGTGPYLHLEERSYLGGEQIPSNNIKGGYFSGKAHDPLNESVLPDSRGASKLPTVPPITQKLPYYAPAGLMKRWTLHDGDKGCQRLPFDDVALSLDRPAPVLPKRASAASGMQPTARPAADPLKKMVTDIMDLHDYLAAPAPAKTAKAALAAPVQPQTKPPARPPVFDLQDIPGAMRKMGWPKSAELMQRWFKGALNYSRSKDEERDGINQNGVRYPAEFVDSQTITWDWLLTYPAVADGLNTLVQPGVIDSPKMNEAGVSAYSNAKKSALKLVNAQYCTFTGEIDALAACKGDVWALHDRCQFQLNKMGFMSYPNSDLAGALGDFAIYAAIAYAKVERQDFAPHTVTITHVYAYVKDNYSFSDDPDKASQYLGHWNKNKVIFSPATSAVQLASSLPLIGGRYEVNYPIARSTTDNAYFDGTDVMLTLGDPLKAEDVFYPARNRDFINWQSKHQQGGNIMVFSDQKLIRLAKPIKFAIPVEG